MLAVYLRVSTGQQDTASQEADLRDWAAQQTEEVRFFSDTFTGKCSPDKRPAFKALWKLITSGKAKTLCCWRLDRLGRQVSSLSKLFEELTSRKVNLISLKDGIDLSTEAGRLLANVLASVAQFETEVRGARVKAGIEAKKARGEKWHKGRRKGTPIKATKKVSAAVRDQKEKGTSISEIARMFKLSRPTVYKILKEAA